MTGAFAANVQFRIFVTMNRQTNIRLFSLLLTICTALGCGCAARPQGMIQPQPQPQKRMIQEPVRFEDGTPVSDEKDADTPAWENKNRYFIYNLHLTEKDSIDCNGAFYLHME